MNSPRPKMANTESNINNTVIDSKIEGKDWLEPIPFSSVSNESTPYPIQALPGILQTTVSEYQKYGQQPMALVACGALANVSLACQALADVARDDYLISPVSVYFISMASSGERKSSSDNVFSRAARLWEEKLREKRAPIVQAATTLHRAWKMQCDEVAYQLKQAPIDSNHSSSIRKLEALMINEPEIPLLPSLYFEDVTHEGLAHHLAKDWPSASIWSDEAGFIVGGYSMQNSPTRFMALLNRLWDAKSFSTHRKSTDKFTLKNRRITLNLMMQPVLMQQILSQPNSIVRHSGFLPRCLLAQPTSLMGKRFYQEFNSSLSCFGDYDRRITDCLSQSEYLTKKGCTDLPVLFMSPAAKKAWVSHFNQLEEGLSEDGHWVNLKDFVSKASENVARIAALFHLFDGATGDICSRYVESAIEIINWHLQETDRLLSEKTSNTPFGDAQKLMNWMISKKSSLTSMRDLQRLSNLRDKSRLNEAIEILFEHQVLRQTTEDKKTYLELNPMCF